MSDTNDFDTKFLAAIKKLKFSLKNVKHKPDMNIGQANTILMVSYEGHILSEMVIASREI